MIYIYKQIINLLYVTSKLFSGWQLNRETKVGQFDVSLVIEENVLRL